MSRDHFVPSDLTCVASLSQFEATALFLSGQEAILAPDISPDDILPGESALRVEKRRAHVDTVKGRIAFDSARAALAS